MSENPEPVRAAGGVVYSATGGVLRVVVVRRPRYGDWSFPKGKAKPGESEETCAVREVEEETGFRCRLGPELGVTRYEDRSGRDKTVRYWAMRPISGEFEPGKEIDELRWLAPAEAASLLSYERDRALLLSSEPRLRDLARSSGPE